MSAAAKRVVNDDAAEAMTGDSGDKIAPRFRRVGRLWTKATRPGCSSRARRALAKPPCHSVA